MGKLFFNHVAAAPPDSILELTAAFNADPRPEKINLSVGLCRTEDLKTPVFASVKEAERSLLEKEETKEYLPIDGYPPFLEHLGALIFGDFFWQKERKRAAMIQTPGGTGALRIGGEFLKQEVGDKIVLSDPTWPNHKGVFSRCGMKVEAYPYYDFKEHSLYWERMVQFLQGLAPGTVVLFHACCHNPTGLDLNAGQWKMIAALVRENNLLPFFDFAYQGFGKGIEEDAAAVRLFASEGIEMLIASSQSKNFGLYGERVGALFILADSEKSACNIRTKIKAIVRTLYSNPPMHGAKIAAEILSSPKLSQKWREEVEGYRLRIEEMRALLAKELSSNSKRRSFDYLLGLKGMFCYTGLSKPQVERIKNEFGVYMVQDGRINIAGLNRKNLLRAAEAILAAGEVS